MKKEGLILGAVVATGISIMNFVSAYGSYGYFSFTNLINTADPLQILSFGAVFLVIFALIRIGLGRTIFKDSMTGKVTATGNVVSAAITFLIMYWGFYQTNFSLASALSSIGLPSNILYIALGVIFLAGMLYIIKKTGFGGFLIVLGAAIVGVTIFTSWVYEKGAAIAMGVVLLLIGLGVWRHSRNTITAAGRWAGSNHGFDKGRSKYEVFFFGIFVLILGLIGGKGTIFMYGIIIAAVGVLWWLLSRRKRDLPVSPQGRYKDTSKRGFFERRKVEAAHEEAINEERVRKRRREKVLQTAYNNAKMRYNDIGLPIPVRKAAGEEIQKIATVAQREGLTIHY